MNKMFYSSVLPPNSVLKQLKNILVRNTRILTFYLLERIPKFINVKTPFLWSLKP